MILVFLFLVEDIEGVPIDQDGLGLSGQRRFETAVILLSLADLAALGRIDDFSGLVVNLQSDDIGVEQQLLYGTVQGRPEGDLVAADDIVLSREVQEHDEVIVQRILRRDGEHFIASAACIVDDLDGLVAVKQKYTEGGDGDGDETDDAVAGRQMIVVVNIFHRPTTNVDRLIHCNRSNRYCTLRCVLGYVVHGFRAGGCAANRSMVHDSADCRRNRPDGRIAIPKSYWPGYNPSSMPL